MERKCLFNGSHHHHLAVQAAAITDVYTVELSSTRYTYQNRNQDGMQDENDGSSHQVSLDNVSFQ